MSIPRSDILLSFINKIPIESNNTFKSIGADKLAKYFSNDVFTDLILKEMISDNAYKEYIVMKNSGASQLSKTLADTIANAMLTWALSKGATHYSHWFHPLLANIGGCAEKHDAFLDFNLDGNACLRFPGKLLIQGEPDASAFPSGGLRETAEARGYTIWDISSPPFVRTQANGTTFIIPTAFCDWHGNSQDRKTPLLRSESALSAAAVHMLHLVTEEVEVAHVTVDCGPEQEFFLIDRGLYMLRPDLINTGRTLIGCPPAKGQDLSDHYFGKIPIRVQAFLNEAEAILWKLGVPLKTRHNEVAPNQYEVAPIYEVAGLATDHNLLVMDVLRELAPKHGLACLLHEKPFAGASGSGKHNNYSLTTDTGINIFDPSDTPKSNMRFVIFLAALIRAVDVHSDLLRAGIATLGNDHRLGAHDAPPAIISMFLGQELDALVQDLIYKTNSIENASAKRKIALGLSKLPHIPRDNTDRNRTSPFAFTGNKFEFRAQGASQSMDASLLMINVSLAESLIYMANEIQTRIELNGLTKQQSIQEVVCEVLRKHYRVVNNGNNHDPNWPAEAEARGLINKKTGPEALEAWESRDNVEMFASLEVLSPDEAHARSVIYHENYLKALLIETRTLSEMVKTSIIPAIIQQQKIWSESLSAAMSVICDKSLFTKQSNRLISLIKNLNSLEDAIETLPLSYKLSEDYYSAELKRFYSQAMESMSNVRVIVDSLEGSMDNNLWPFPKYSELLFLT